MKKACALFLFSALFTVFPVIITFAQDLQEGNATWYEDDSLDLHASHARLPPGTKLRVTNTENQKEVYVTVMGRIQNSDNRILDISQAAAELLEMNERGYTPIRMVVMRGLVSEPTSASSNAAANNNDAEPSYEDDSVPDVAYSRDDEETEDSYNGNYNGYGGYEDYADETPDETAYAGTPSSPPPPVRPYPQQSAPQTQPRQTAPQTQPRQTVQPLAGHVLLKQMVVIINGKEQTIDVPDGVYIPLPPPGQAPSKTIIPPVPQYAPPPKRVYIQAPPPPPPPSPPPAQPPSPVIRIIPTLPDPHSGKVYRIQLGAFSQPSLAQVCFERLRSAGLSPAYEQNGSLYRVVLSGIRAADVYYTAQRLGAAGFTEAWIREESRY
jgi:cell division protein FtsN